MKTWQSMSPAKQAAFQAAADKAIAWSAAEHLKKEAELADGFKKQGLDVYAPDVGAFRVRAEDLPGLRRGEELAGRHAREDQRPVAAPVRRPAAPAAGRNQEVTMNPSIGKVGSPGRGAARRISPPACSGSCSSPSLCRSCSVCLQLPRGLDLRAERHYLAVAGALGRRFRREGERRNPLHSWFPGSVGPRTRRAMGIIIAVAIVGLYAASLPASYSYVSFMKVERPRISRSASTGCSRSTWCSPWPSSSVTSGSCGAYCAATIPTLLIRRP